MYQSAKKPPEGYQLTRSGNWKPAKMPPTDITLDKNGNRLSDKQIAKRKRQLSVNGTSGRRTVARGADYYAYLRSPEWADVKKRYLLSGLPKDCFVCREPWQWNFHFHHRTYKNLGWERLFDIVPVCSTCHDRIHRTVKPTFSNLWKATTNARRNLERKRQEEYRKSTGRNKAPPINPIQPIFSADAKKIIGWK